MHMRRRAMVSWVHSSSNFRPLISGMALSSISGCSVSELRRWEIHAYAEEGNGFLGTFFFQFQTAYFRYGSELNFGMFGLGAAEVGDSCICGGGQWFPGYILLPISDR